ncbi:MAG: hypothetical protein KGJ79_05390 [Alphaproteobacteria bacterium]|nr:hypothetical protein [Alphaproteobacteria bacterium]MDE2110555.1 hypothetical protein [Alphaproteobacteria bacterium]MDE2492717.1 hypothetical protein [Alphaproteobacteria bacterium]
MRPRFATRAIVVASVLLLAGCGTTPGDRMLSGAMLGAAGGSIIGAATGNPATGAAIGAVSGAVIGGVTNPCDLDLGTPYWRRHGGRRGYDERCRRHRND